MDQYDILECRSMAKCIGKMFIKRNCQKVNFQYWLILIWTYLVVSQSTNLYGSHPFYMNVNPETGTGFGFFWLNSNAMGKHCFKYITLFLPQARARDDVRYSQKKRSLLSTWLTRHWAPKKNYQISLYYDFCFVIIWKQGVSLVNRCYVLRSDLFLGISDVLSGPGLPRN